MKIFMVVLRRTLHMGISENSVWQGKMQGDNIGENKLENQVNIKS